MPQTTENTPSGDWLLAWRRWASEHDARAMDELRRLTAACQYPYSWPSSWYGVDGGQSEYLLRQAAAQQCPF